jgi:hypothetical protein
VRRREWLKLIAAAVSIAIAITAVEVALAFYLAGR